jgi:nitrite reductase/ring-hydroxylating ferredoxin subunit
MNFLNKCTEKYPTEFDYSKVKYVNNRTKVIITCNKHNHEFQIAPGNFLSYKYPCPLCRKENGRSKINDKNSYYSITINDRIIQCDKNLVFVQEYMNLDDIFNKTMLNKIKKADIKRCCNLNHNKLNENLLIIDNQLKFQKISNCCSNIWLYKCDYNKLKRFI